MTRNRSRSTASRRPRTGIVKVLRAACIVFAVGAIAVLGAFHAWLLLTRLSSAGAFDALAALRWSGAAAVLLALVALHRLGIPLVGSRQAAVVWLATALLHVGASAPVPFARNALPVTPGLLVAIPAVSASVLTIAAVASLERRRPRSPGAARPVGMPLWLVRSAGAALAFDGFAAAFAARPPPR
jgi:hypothetical protein